MKNKPYWKQRFEQLEAASNKDAIKTFSTIQDQYITAEREIERQISTWYQRFATNNQITMAEARKLLTTSELAEFKWDVKEFIKYGEENALNSLWMKELENASARFHVSRLEALKVQTQQTAEKLFGGQLDEMDALLKKNYLQNYYHTVYEVQKGFNIGWDIAAIDDRTIERLISKPWATDGKNFSDRIWSNRTSLINEVQTQLTRTFMLGKSPDDAIEAISKKMNSSLNQAGRLVMTESAYFSSQSQKDAFNSLDVDKYEIVATLDRRTSDICQDMDGQVFDMKNFEPGVTAPPFHPWCRTTTVPYFDDNFTERAARGEDGKTYYVDSRMKYSDWKKTFVDNGSKSGVKPISKSGIIKPQQNIDKLEKLKNSGMLEDDYDKYLSIINDHDNPYIQDIYSKYGDDVNGIKLTKSGSYSPGQNTIKFSYPQYDDMNKYGTLAHEYGHFFDEKVVFEGLNFKEIEEVRKATGLNVVFKDVASSSDEFLAAIRKDKEYIKGLLTPELKADLIANNASHGVQDAIDGLFPKSRLRWGHGERYYNRKYADVEFLDKFSSTATKKQALKQAYLDLGFDASSQAKVKNIVRNYEAASEAWANIMSAETCGGESLEYIKTYLPNSYELVVELLKGVK